MPDSPQNKKTCTIQFLPSGDKVEAPVGTSILDAARAAGVFIDSICGGDGVCGKCRVIVRKGRVTGGTTKLLTREQIQEGFILACEGKVAGDVTVEVPVDQQAQDDLWDADIPGQRPGETASLERRSLELDPLVKKHTLKPAEPTLENKPLRPRTHRAGAARAGRRAGNTRWASTSFGCWPDAIRDDSRLVTVTTANRGCLREIADMAPGGSSAPNLAVALDLGTTSIVAHLIELSTGQTLAASSKYNAQIAYGADVLRRIIWCMEEPDGLAATERGHRGRHQYPHPGAPR